jgi:hypothetical protein
MEFAMNEQKSNPNTINLVEVVNVLLKWKWAIILGTLGVLLLSVAISFTLPKVYRSEGFLQLSYTGIDLDLDKLKTTPGQNDALLNQTLLMNELLLLNQTLEGGGLLTKSMSIPDFKKYYPRFTDSRLFQRFLKPGEKLGGQSLEPVYAYNKKDLNDMGQISKDAPNFVVGVKVRSEQPSPKTAIASVAAYGNYIRDCVLYGKLNDYIFMQLKKSRTNSKSPEEELKYEFFSKTRDALETEEFGENLLHKILEIKDSFFAKTDTNELDMDLDNIRNLCKSIRFFSGPSQPSNPVAPRKSLIWAVSFVLGFCFFVVLAFFVEWWKTNKDKIKK